MIQQFVALGRHFMRRETRVDQAEQYAQDPSKKFRSRTVYLLVFSDRGFSRVQSEEYSADRRSSYLYRPGPPNGFDATPTTGLPTWKTEGEFADSVPKRLTRLARSLEAALASEDPSDDPREHEELCAIRVGFPGARDEILRQLKALHPDSKQQATMTVAWKLPNGDLKRVGDYPVFRRAVVDSATKAFAGKKTQGTSSGHGQCSICGAHSEVFGGLQVPNFKFYTLDKRGSVSGGFDPTEAWRNFPACEDCCKAADYAGERVKAELAFGFYGFKYLLLPVPLAALESDAFPLLKRLSAARMAKKAIRRLTDAEDEILYVLSEENNLIQVDLLFYRPDPNYFRPALYVSGMLPSHFRKLFDAKGAVDTHPWFMAPSPTGFTNGAFTFGALRRVLPAAHGGSTFDDDFLEAVRCALELRAYSAALLLAMGMRWIRQGFAARGRADEGLVADLTRTLFFFEAVAGPSSKMGEASMGAAIYGDSPQADRVRAFFEQAAGLLRSDAAAQAAFLLGACCKRIMDIQDRIRGARPFFGKLKGLRVSEGDLKRLLPEAVGKSEAYGEDNRRIVAPLLECAGAAMAAAGDGWKLSADEISYYFALGLVLASRLAAKDASAAGGAGA